LINALKGIEIGGRAAKSKDFFYKTNISTHDKDTIDDQGE